MGGRSRIVTLRSPDATHSFGQHVARLLPPGSILALHGPLGAGKTSFVQGLAKGLDICTPIQSPTFTYCYLYEEGARCLYHFDLYRMKDSSDFFALGFEEYFSLDGITAIEWPERLGNALPSRTLAFHFSYADASRSVYLSSSFDSDLITLLAKWD